MRVRLDLGYVGTRYAGWQRQPDGASVQATLESILSRLYDRPIRVTGAGRTDAGVHARGQVAHFDTPKSRPSVKDLPRILNKLLPDDISIFRARQVPGTFHARKQAISREYLYKILVSSNPDPFRTPFVWHCPHAANLSTAKLRRIAQDLSGKRDFSSFTIRRAEKQNTVRTMKRIEIRRKADELQIRFVADSFLHRMVRRIVAYLIETALGRDRAEPPYTAPASGLCLMKVGYRSSGERNKRLL